MGKPVKKRRSRLLPVFLRAGILFGGISGWKINWKICNQNTQNSTSYFLRFRQIFCSFRKQLLVIIKTDFQYK
jgi:hypothetical protein